MRAKSLRRELLGWLVLPLAAVVSLNLWTTYNNALDTADLITERTLLSSARAIAESVRQSDGVLEAPIPPAALEMFASDPPDRVVYRVTAPRGELLAGYADVLVPPQVPKGLQPLYFDSVYGKERVRAVAIAQPVVGSDNPGNALVAVGQTLHSHDRLVFELWRKALFDQILLVAAAGLLALLGLNRGLAPVMRLREAVIRRDPAVLEPLATDNVQTELKPLVAALNEAFARVLRQIATQRRFIANAAHQLRNPLALARTQANVGLRAASPEAKDEALAGIDRAVGRMAYLSNQLLQLARAEQGSALLRKETVDFERIAHDAIESIAEAALARSIDLGFETGGAPLPIHGHSSLLRELVANLIDNAVRYTPSGGTVTASLQCDGREIVFRVEDSGPGIPEAERELVFERFYRRLETGSEGSGLGLAIVREIVLAHDGTIALQERTPTPGLVATVRLPAAATSRSETGLQPAIASR
jgi:two-component system, OmpR family, sensor histidine kinase TctE